MTDNRTTEQTVTERLRALLDERGVEWKPIDGEHICFTEWYTHSGAFVYTARESFRSYGDHMLRVETCGLPKACLIATPEQVIAATIGSEREKQLEKLVQKALDECWCDEWWYEDARKLGLEANY